MSKYTHDTLMDFFFLTLIESLFHTFRPTIGELNYRAKNSDGYQFYGGIVDNPY